MNDNFNLNSTSGKKSHALPIAIGSAVAFIIICVCLVLFNPTINNFCKLKVLKPEKYLQSVEANYCKEKSENVQDGLKRISNDKYKDNMKVSTKMDISLSEDTQSLLQSFAGAKKDSNSALPIDKISNISINSTSNLTENAKSFNLSLKLNTNDVVDADVILDTEKNTIYLQIPTVSKTWLSYDLTTGLSEDQKNELLNSLNTSFSASALSSINFKDILLDYSSLVFNNLKNVEKTEGQEIKVNGSSQSCTELTSKLTNENVNEIATKILEKAKDDKDLYNLVSTLGIFKDEDSYKKAIDKNLEDIKNDKSDASKELCTITAWVDSKGQIIGHEFSNPDNDKLGYKTVSKDNDKFVFTLYADEYSIDGDYTLKDNAYTGSASIVLPEESKEIPSISFDFTDLKTEDGFMEGSFTINVDDVNNSLVKNSSATIDYSRDGDTQKSKTALSASGLDLLTISSETTIEKADEVKQPSKATKISNDSSQDLLEYFKQVKLTNISENLTKAVNDENFTKLVNTYMKQFGFDKFDGSQSDEDVAKLFNKNSSSSESSDTTNQEVPSEEEAREQLKDLGYSDEEIDSLLENYNK